MDNTKFQFAPEEKTGIVRASLEGFWTVDTVDSYWNILEDRIKRSQDAHGRLLMVMDCTRLQVQPNDVVARMEERGVKLISNERDRIAVIVDSSLLKMQGKRVLDSSQIQNFGSQSEAEKWLSSLLSS